MVGFGHDAVRLAAGGGPFPGGSVVGGLVSGGQLLSREAARPVVSSGFRGLDTLLPAGGVRPGSLIEWFAGSGAATVRDEAASPADDAVALASGAASLAFAVACRLAAAGGGGDGTGRPRTIVVVDRTGWFHPPAVLPWLDDERRLVVARPSRDDDEIWAIDQALRCTGVAAVLAWPRGTAGGPRRGGARSSGSWQQWSTAMRRWQLAAASSGAVGLLVRSAAARGEPSWAEARIAVSPRPGGSLLERRLQLALAGGAWSAADPGTERSAEVLLDLARAVEAPARHAAAVRDREAVAAGPARWRGRTGERHAFPEAGAACRAS